jgi:hypothetical protein
LELIVIAVTAVPLNVKELMVCNVETLESQVAVDTTVPPVISEYVPELAE